MPRARGQVATLLSGRLDTTSAGVELALVRAFAGLRAVNLIQLLLSVAVLLTASPRPGTDAALVVLYTTWSVAAVAIAVRQRAITDPRLVAADVTVALLVLAASPLITTSTTRINTWHAWAHPVSLSTALLLGAALSPRLAAAGTTALAAVYVATTMPMVTGPGQKWTVLTNAVAYLAFTLIGSALAGFLRRLGADADTERERIAVLSTRVGAEAEMERHRRLLHDHAALLSFIGSTDPHTHPDLQASLRAQAAAGANRVTAFLSSSAAAPSTPDLTLAEVAQHAASAFPDLPVTVNADLATSFRLPAAMAGVVSGAVTTLLHNVRSHAAATNCTVHAVGQGTWWEVTVRDDGVGFDPATTTVGYGLSRQVRAACAAHGIDVVIDSAPGDGTTATLTFGTPAPEDGPPNPTPAQAHPAPARNAAQPAQGHPGLSRAGEPT